jgi:hypothetical protein
MLLDSIVRTLMTKSRKRPPQGTGSIFNPEKALSFREWGADKVLTDLQVVMAFEDAKDEDYIALQTLKREGFLTDERAAPYLKRLYEKFPRPVVGRAFRMLKFSPHDLA